MPFSTEITIYVIALTIVIGMAFMVHSTITMYKRLQARMDAQKSQLMTLILTSKNIKGQSKIKIDQYLEGEIDLTHPVSGKQLKAKAKFKIKK